jgi:twinkle protein
MVDNEIKGKPIRKEPCELCGSSDAKQVFEKPDGAIDAYCFSCLTYYPKNKLPQENHRIEPKKTKPMFDINNVDSLPIRSIRGVRQEICEGFGVKVLLSEKDGKTVTHEVYPDRANGNVVGYEVKSVDKQITSVGDRKGSLELWGQHIAMKNGGKKLFITEGRLDCMSLYQAIFDNKSKSYAGLPSVVSITKGVNSAVKDIVNNREFVDRYDEVILVFDTDDAGKKAVKDVLKVFPRFKVATLPMKDANEMLQADKSYELFQNAMFKSDYIRQGELVDIDGDLIQKALVKPEMGIPFPWESVNKATFGIRPHTIHVVGAAPKVGKSHHEYQLIQHLIKSGHKVGVFDLENAPVKTALRIASKHAKQDFTRPDKEFDPQTVHDTLLELQGYVRFYDRGASRDWSDIRICIEEMHLLDKINLFFIDPLTALISRYNSSEANDKLNEICTDMADLVNLYPITLFCYSHVNPKPKGFTPHEAGAKVLSSEFTGSRAMEKWFHYGHGISRDRTDECPIERRNVSEFYMLFDREYGQQYKCDVHFDEETVQYLEARHGLHSRH